MNIIIINTLAAFSGKHDVYSLGVRLSVCSVFFSKLNETHQGAAHDAASVHFHPNIMRTDGHTYVYYYYALVIYLP